MQKTIVTRLFDGLADWIIARTTDPDHENYESNDSRGKGGCEMNNHTTTTMTRLPVVNFFAASCVREITYLF